MEQSGSACNSRNFIMVVDDNHVIADTLQAVLRTAGFEVEVFYEASSALQHAHACPPQVLLSDIMMPGIDGLALADLLSAQHPRCQVILMSGNSAVLGDCRSKTTRYRFIEKPVRPQTLISLLRATTHKPHAVALQQAV